MTDRTKSPIAPLARWSRRCAVFAACLIATGVLLHRFASFPTPAAINLFAVGFGVSLLAVLTGTVALAQIWRRGHAGAGAAAVGVLLPLAVAAWPLAYVPAIFKLPRINDVTTD